MAISKDTIERRLGAVRRAMRARGIGRLVLTGEANVSYLTGFAGSDSWALITGRKSYLLTDSRYSEQAGKECPICSIVERTGSLAELVGKLAGGAARPYTDRGHFFRVAARAMRQVLVDHARARRTAKRQAVQAPVLTLPDGDGLDDLLAVDAALEKLAALDPRQARVIELRFFAGLGIEETAAALGISPATVKRDWLVARAWLQRELGAG